MISRYLQPGALILNYGTNDVTFCQCLETDADPAQFTLTGFYLLYYHDSRFIQVDGIRRRNSFESDWEIIL